jgi:hypothetical protein
MLFETSFINTLILQYGRSSNGLRPVETVPGMREGGIKKDGGDELNYDIL